MFNNFIVYIYLLYKLSYLLCMLKFTMVWTIIFDITNISGKISLRTIIIILFFKRNV